MMQPTKIGIDQFWELLQASQLVPAAEFDRLTKKSASLKHSSPESIAKWLVDQKVITELHSEVLQAGHQGPFEFGRYRILARAPGGDKTWEARDLKTSHPVWLHFFAGQSSADFATWDKIEEQAEKFQSVQHPNLLRVYECVTTRQYRFVATSDGDGKSLAEKMPLKSRLNEEQALALIHPIASAMARIEESNMAHGDLSLDHVFHNAKAGVTKVLPPVMRVNPAQKKSDVNSLGRLLYRVLSGRDAMDQEQLADVDVETFTEPLRSRKIGAEVCEIVFESLTNNSFTAKEFLSKVKQASTETFEEPSSKTSSQEAKFLAALSPWDVEREQLPEDVAIPSVDEQSADSVGDEQVRKKKKYPVPVALGLSLLGFAACLGIVAVLANLVTVDRPETQVAQADPEEEIDTPIEVETPADPLPNLDPGLIPIVAEPTKPAVSASAQRYQQEFVADDLQTLWESPTTGFPVDTSFVPAAPRIIAAINWSSIYQSAYGQRTIQSLGPAMERQRKELESRTGFALPDIKSTVISFHSNAALEYETCVVVTLLNPVSQDTCLKVWNQPTAVQGNEDVFEKKPGTAWWIAEKSDTGGVVSFVVGPSERVQRAAAGEVALLTGAMRNLVAGSDADRDVNLMFPTISLFNTEGQTLVAQNQKWANELRVSLPESVRGLLISVHNDAGDYIEFRVDHTADLNSSEATEAMRDFARKKLTEVSQGVDQRQALPFWEPVRARFGAMLGELSSQLRWNTELGDVVGNAWLPPGAMHNLFAATELAMSFEPSKVDLAAVKKPKIPQTLEELLATRRNLTIANPPDLNVLLKNIQEEVSDQYLEMPFKFNIQIAGTDLQKDGITQNQRPGALRIVDKSLSEILTQVMVSANPNREISGAADPNCKLVWVTAKDEESGESIVLITTRSAAAQKSLQLPDAFVSKP